MYDRVNWETIRMIKLLNKFAEASKYGILPLSQVTDETYDGHSIIYDDKFKLELGYPVLDTTWFEINGLDDLLTYNHEFDDIDIVVQIVEDEDNGDFPIVSIIDNKSEYAIDIYDGKWHIST